MYVCIFEQVKYKSLPIGSSSCFSFHRNTVHNNNRWLCGAYVPVENSGTIYFTLYGIPYLSVCAIRRICE